MKLVKSLLLVTLALAAVGVQAKYNGEDRGRPVMPAEINAKMQAECSGCHMAFPPGLLPAASWKKVMTGLDKHFGTDASLSAADTKEITDYLVKYGSNRWTASTAPLRITESEWFKAKHLSGEISPAVWKRESVKSASNCMACHSGADKGDYNERNIHIPK
ncbi:diheme cytochrome c [Rhodoferax sp.]|uniref:diheme cytochrome c n=1 Tax=Rhodoferax sp. TaxID=50421 RepID=UPI00262323D3|nr:diheme cytochrome c [Rhodoferax sp.]MDD2924352.1 diheme cytochrome c [Rhodoferax sp.]